MADIQLHQFPDAGVISTSDFLYLSQSSADKKVTIGDLASNFGEVDIYGMVSTTPLGTQYLPVSTTVDVAGNRKVTLDNVGILFQEDQYFSDNTNFPSTSKVIYRDGDDADGLSEMVALDFQKEMLNLPNLVNLGTGTNDSDMFSVYDVSASEAKRITGSDLRNFTLDPANLPSLLNTTLDNADLFQVYDDSESTAKKITYQELFTKVSSDMDLSGYVNLTTDQTVGGVKTFTSTANFSGTQGLKVDKIAEYTANAGVTIESTLLKDNTVTASKLHGSLQPQSIYQSLMRTAYSPNWGIYESVYNAANGTGLQNTSGDFLEVYGDNPLAGLTKGGIVPEQHQTYTLGTKDREWGSVYSRYSYLNSIYCSVRAQLPTGTYINNVALMDGSTIAPNILPTATESARGAIEVASGNNIQGKTSKDALTPWSINEARFDLVSRGVAKDRSGNSVTNTLVYAGSVKFGGLIINYGYIEFNSSYNYNVKDFRIDYGDSGMFNFQGDSSYSVNLRGENESTNRELDHYSLDSSTTQNYLDIHTNRANNSWQTGRIYFQIIGN